MKKYDSFLIGHISVDEIQELNGERYGFYGGAELFSSYAAYFMGAKVGILTKMTKDQKKIMDILPFDCEDIYFIESGQNTSMVNKYLTEDREKRDLIVSSVADPFSLSDIPDHIESSIYHLAGLIYGDFDDNMIECLAEKGKVAVDMQGYLRCLDPDSRMLYFRNYDYMRRDFSRIYFLKTDAAEAEMITGLTDRKEAAKLMCQWGAKEVMITHNSEVLVCDGERIFTSPIKSRNFSGRAGRGDTTFSIYITERLHAEIPEALEFASAAVSLKMEHPGPLKKTRQDVENYRTLYYK